MNTLENMLAVASNLKYKVIIVTSGKPNARSQHSRFNRAITVNDSQENIPLVLAHELGHALMWERGEMVLLRQEMSTRRKDFERSLPRKNSIANAVANINFEQALSHESLRRIEIRAWVLGEEFIPMQDRVLYWRVADERLLTYGITR